METNVITIMPVPDNRWTFFPPARLGHPRFAQWGDKVLSYPGPITK
jgi:hypothetical protein